MDRIYLSLLLSLGLASPALAQEASVAGADAPSSNAAAVDSQTSSSESAADLAKKVSNPIGSLISVPFQFDYDKGIGSDHGHRITLNVNPVVPITLNDNLTLISRTIITAKLQNDVVGDSGTQFGLGDTLQTFYFVPRSSGGLIWVAGPAIMLPTGTDRLLSSRKWSAGPTAVVLSQTGPWTVGMMAYQIWSFAGNSRRENLNSLYMQPFVTYGLRNGWTLNVDTESSYDWKGKSWSVPVNFYVGKVTQIGKQSVNLQAGIRYWASSPESGPDGVGFRFAINFLFPK